MNDQKTITIKEALSFPEGTPIPRIVGKVTHIFDRKSGEGKRGAYTIQSGVIEQDGSKILFTVWNKPEFPQDYKGQTIIFRAGTGKKPTMTLKSDFKDASKRTLNVTASCFVLTEDEETDDIPMEFPDPELKKQQAQQSAPQANVAQKKAIPANGVQEVKHRVMQLANLREICDHAAQFLYDDANRFNEEYVKDIATSIFIQACRESLHDKLPNNKPLSKKEDVEATENLEEKEDEIF